MSLNYRREVDGLRALAVIPVIFFHADFAVFSGGFVGVDVFFVISGYLITSILIDDIEKNRFSILHFYERRARRILPALFFIMLFCIPFAWMWMLPNQFRDFSQSVVATSLFSSNILFWLESGYFDTESNAKPLLHTWSLAVEEQYYIIFPIFLLAAWRFGKRRVFWIISAVAVLSLALSEWSWRTQPAANFYLLPTRIWELLSGSIVALLANRYGVLKNDALAGVGLAAIVFSIFAYDASTPFPSLYTLIPVGGTALLLLFGGSDTLVARLLSARLLVGIGLISYSAYLWHQPLFAFARIRLLEAPSMALMLLLSVASIALAALTWKFIEQPFRRGAAFSGRKILFGSAAAISIMAASGTVVYLNNDQLLPGQYNPLNTRISIANYEHSNRLLQKRSWDTLRALAADPDYGTDANPYDDTPWYDAEDPRPKVLLLGNSHSKDLFNVLGQSEETTRRYQLARYGAQLSDLHEAHRFFSSPNFEAADIVVVSSRYSPADLAALRRVVALLKQAGKRIVLVENVFEFREFRNREWSLIDKIVYESSSKTTDPRVMSEIVNRSYFAALDNGETDPLVGRANARIAELAAEFDDIIVLDRMDYICDRAAERCDAVGPSLRKHFYDHGHHTLEGARFFGRRVDQIDWFDIGVN